MSRTPIRDSHKHAESRWNFSRLNASLSGGRKFSDQDALTANEEKLNVLLIEFKSNGATRENQDGQFKTFKQLALPGNRFTTVVVEGDVLVDDRCDKCGSPLGIGDGVPQRMKVFRPFSNFFDQWEPCDWSKLEAFVRNWDTEVVNTPREKFIMASIIGMWELLPEEAQRQLLRELPKPQR